MDFTLNLGLIYNDYHHRRAIPDEPIGCKDANENGSNDEYYCFPV
jgi:hypothetical protein